MTAWRRSPRCDDLGCGDCVETASAPGAVLVRDSALGEHSPVITLSRSGFAGLLASIKETT